MSTHIHTAIGLIGPGTIGSFQVPNRSPNPDEVLIKVDFAAFALGDVHAILDQWFVQGYPHQLGLVATGKVIEVGSNVSLFHVGDTVGAFTQPGGDRGIQEYIVAPAHRVVKIPDGIRQEDVAAIIDNFACAWMSITTIGIPLPSTLPPSEPLDTSITSTPIVIWGGGTGCAIYTIQLLRLAGYTNLITTTSTRTAAAAKGFGAAHVFDYNDPEVVSKIKAVAGGPIKCGYDSVGTRSSLKSMAELVTEPGSKFGFLIPVKTGDISSIHDLGAELSWELPEDLKTFREGVEVLPIATFQWEKNHELKHVLLNKMLPELLKSGSIKPQDVYVVSEGTLTERVQKAHELIQGGILRGVKVVIDMKY